MLRMNLKLFLYGALLFSLASCEGGGSSGAPAGPAPTPTPTITPSPSPTPSPTPSGSTFAVARPGESIGGPLACAEAANAVVDGSGHLSGLGSIIGTKIDNGIEINYLGPDTYTTDINGFGGSAYTPADKRTSPNPAYDQFLRAPDDEFFIMANGRSFATLGLTGTCFFAAGLQADSLPTGADVDDYYIMLDGIAQVSGQNYRLLPSAGSLTVNFVTRVATLHLELKGRSNAFEDFTIQPQVDIATADVGFTFNELGGIGLANVTGTNGYSGTLTGQFVGNAAGNVSGRGGSGLALVFELRSANGDVIYGAIVGERNLI